MKQAIIMWGSIALGVAFIVLGIGYIAFEHFVLPVALGAFR